MSSRPYVIISADAHAGADLLDYRRYLPSEFHEEFDAWATDFHEPWTDYDTEMMDTDDEALRIGISSFQSRYNWESDSRLEHMNGDGIAAEVVFPNTVPPFFPVGVINAPGPTTAEEYRLRFAGIQAHNRWLVDFCAQAPGRRGGLAQVFLDDLDDAINEVRWAKEQGLIGVLIPSDHTLKLVPLYERRLDPFWAVCEELQMPVHRHSITVGPPETEETGPAAVAVGALETGMFFQRGLAHLMFGGVFQRYPELKFIFTETGCTWVAQQLGVLDYQFSHGVRKGDASYPLFHRALEGLELTPSAYFQRNCWLGTSLMLSMDVEARHQVGVEKLMWGADYPHHEGTYPRTRLALRVLFSEVPEHEVRMMLGENAGSVYGFDMQHLQRIADSIGPTPEEIAVPVSRDELPKQSVQFTIGDAIEKFVSSI